jgi:hypothetical protein
VCICTYARVCVCVCVCVVRDRVDGNELFLSLGRAMILAYVCMHKH